MAHSKQDSRSIADVLRDSASSADVLRDSPSIDDVTQSGASSTRATRGPPPSQHVIDLTQPVSGARKRKRATSNKIHKIQILDNEVEEYSVVGNNLVAPHVITNSVNDTISIGSCDTPSSSESQSSNGYRQNSVTTIKYQMPVRTLVSSLSNSCDETGDRCCEYSDTSTNADTSTPRAAALGSRGRASTSQGSSVDSCDPWTASLDIAARSTPGFEPHFGGSRSQRSSLDSDARGASPNSAVRSNPGFEPHYDGGSRGASPHTVSCGASRRLRRGRGHMVPETQKDEVYWSKRERNNLSAQRSRQKRRQKDETVHRLYEVATAELARVKHELSEIKRFYGLRLDQPFSAPDQPVNPLNQPLNLQDQPMNPLNQSFSPQEQRINAVDQPFNLPVTEKKRIFAKTSDTEAGSSRSKQSTKQTRRPSDNGVVWNSVRNNGVVSDSMTHNGLVSDSIRHNGFVSYSVKHNGLVSPANSSFLNSIAATVLDHNSVVSTTNLDTLPSEMSALVNLLGHKNTISPTTTSERLRPEMAALT